MVDAAQGARKAARIVSATGAVRLVTWLVTAQTVTMTTTRNAQFHTEFIIFIASRRFVNANGSPRQHCVSIHPLRPFGLLSN